MFKTIVFTFLALMMCLAAQAKSYLRSHEDFVHLSDYEKNQIIIKTMELVVELETKYQYEVKKYGYNKDRFENFRKTVNKINSLLFIQSAYAQSNNKLPLREWKDHGEAFTSLLNKKEGDCIFAGWISKSYMSNGKTYCGHPDFWKGAGADRHSKGMAAVTKAYPDPKSGSGCALNDRTKIQCNPAIFGYKKATDQTLFCVEASNGAHNSSYHCMKAALEISKDEVKVDKPAYRLQYIRENLAANPAVFKGVQEFVYKTCICEEAPRDFNKNYHTYMRPHRTCYGLMGMMAETVACEDPKLPIDTSIFSSIQNFAKEKISTSSSEAEIDYHYGIFVKNEVKNLAPTEYNRLCGGSPPQKKPEPPVVTPSAPTLPEKPSVEPKKYICSAAVCNNQTQENEEGSDKASSEVSCTFNISEEGKEDSVELTDAKYSPPKEGETKVSVSGKISDKEVSLSCPLQTEEEPVAYTCQKAVCESKALDSKEEVSEKDSSETTCTFSVTAEGTDEAVELSEAKYDPPAGDAKTLSVSGLILEKEVSLSCPIEKSASEEKPEDSGRKPTLKLEISSKGIKFYTVKAIATDDLGWTFAWSFKDHGKSTPKPGWKKQDEPEPKKKKGMSDDGSLGEEDPTPSEPTGDKRETNQERAKEDYKVCGQLSKGAEKVPETPACVTIDKVEEIKAPINPGNQPGMPPMPPRQSSDTSAMGIR